MDDKWYGKRNMVGITGFHGLHALFIVCMTMLIFGSEVGVGIGSGIAVLDILTRG